jgi:hypothetical protein
MELCWHDLPWLRQLVTGFPLQKSGFNSRPVCVGFVVNKLALEKVFLRVFLYFPVIVIPLMTHANIPSTYH